MAMKAVVTTEDGVGRLDLNRKLPVLRPGYVKVAVKAIALNPTDWKALAAFHKPGYLVGCDYTGTVVEVSPESSKAFQIGDRIAGFAHGGNTFQSEDGAFAEFVVGKTDVQLRVPKNITDTQAATLPVGIATCGQALYQTLGLNLPTCPADNTEAIFIFGGSTATGALGIQFAKLSGYKVITTCSPHNFEYVRSLGADAVFDYKDPERVAKIIAFAGGKLTRIWDTVSIVPSARTCAQVIADGGHYTALLPVKCRKSGIVNSMTMGYTIMGEPVDKGWFKQEDTQIDFDFARSFALIAENLLAEGKLKAHKARVFDTGLDGVLDGLQLLRSGNVSGEKLVYLV